MYTISNFTVAPEGMRAILSDGERVSLSPYETCNLLKAGHLIDEYQMVDGQPLVTSRGSTCTWQEFIKSIVAHIIRGREIYLATSFPSVRASILSLNQTA
jgi:hypothetical protein